jgi:polyphosphate:AMP phosphotransferase
MYHYKGIRIEHKGSSTIPKGHAMLESLDLTQTIDKDDYRKRIAPLEVRIGELQRAARECRVPVILVFEGWGAAGKGTLINTLITSLDPRGFNVYSTLPPTEEERMRPFLWRFWTKTPEQGRIALFDRSWYGRVLQDRVNATADKGEIMRAYDEIDSFERQLIDGGALIVKYFLHIGKKEQKKRFEKLESNPTTAWRVTREDWKHFKQYEQYAVAIEDMLARTSTEGAPWTIVEAHDRRFATIKVFETLVVALEGAIDTAKSVAGRKKKADLRVVPHAPPAVSILDKADLSRSLVLKEYDEEMAECRQKLWELEHRCYLKRLPVIVAFEGWDAAGKGGAIRRLAGSLDPRGYEVVPFGAPNDVEKLHHYLWRFWIHLPKAGHLTIFDRSWYGRVLVERVEGFCSDEAWERAYREINETEKQWAESGAAIMKFWLHISEAEQLKRFREREKDPDKTWKITPEDWRNREKWDAYRAAVDEMLLRTDKPHARWTVVEANSKYFARVKVLKTVIKTIEAAL